MELQFHQFLLDLDAFADDKCGGDKVQVYDGPGTESPLLGRFCGSNVEKILLSSGNNLFITLDTDQRKRGLGFKAEYARKWAPSGRSGATAGQYDVT